MLTRLEEYFDFQGLGTTWRIELLAGLTTFVTMAYIVFVNPAILHDAGMPVRAVTFATCLAAAFGSFLMGVVARYPIALAPGMGLNAYFTYTVVKGMGVPWQAALGAVFLSGVIFLILTLVGIRQMILATIPFELYSAVSAGVGLFIAFIGLRNAGIIVAHPATILGLGNFRSPSVMLACFGLCLTAVLLARGTKAAILLGIVVTTVLAFVTGQSQSHLATDLHSSLTATFFQLDVRSTLSYGFVEIVFVFLFVDFFDNVGTLVAVGKKAGLIEDRSHAIPRLNQIFLADSVATIFSSLAGTSTVVSYVESAAGVSAGGRSGVTAVVVGLLFLLSLLATPVLGLIPSSATAPALIVVGSMMMVGVVDINWLDPLVAIPAFLTIIMIPLTFSIANGLAFGFIAYAVLKLGAGQGRQVHWLVYLLAALFIIRFAYLGGSS